MATIGLVLDCADPRRLATFWTDALHYANLGAAGGYVLLADEAGKGPNLLLQQVDEPKVGKNRMHFDLHEADVDAEVARLEALGATRVDGPTEEHGSRWVVMADPEGNEFCLVYETAQGTTG